MLQRHIYEELKAYLAVMPVVLITGARQTGKTTLIEWIAKEKGYPLITFDDTNAQSSASRDPQGWIEALPKPIILDEVQKVPEIFLAIKKDVDQNRHPGRFLLTGSANPLLLPRVSDSLAGRMGSLPLFPFSQGELRKKNETFIPKIFADSFSLETYGEFSLSELRLMVLRGGFPTVQGFANLADVNRWIRSYIQTMIERDVRDISNIEGLRELPRLFRLLASRSGNLLNLSEISRSIGLVNMTLHRYLRLLETLYFVYLLLPWHTNRGKRLIKSPKMHLCDTALMAQLLEVDEKLLAADPRLMGQFLESFVFSELLKQKSWAKFPVELYHFRDGDREVDFLMEKSDGTLVGIEVKLTKTIRSDDLRGLIHLKNLAGRNFKRGIVLHLGEKIEPLGNDLWAMPIQSLWG